jgi:hypothetical protein
MKWARPLLVLDGLLLTIFIVGGVLFAASAAIRSLDPNFAIPVLSEVIRWNYFGSSVFWFIVIAVQLGTALAFWSAPRPEPITITDKVPEAYQVTSKDDQPHVNIHAPDNRGTVIGVNQGQVNIGREPQLLLAPWSVVKLPDGTYQSETTLTSDTPTTFPRITLIAKSPSIMELTVSPNGGIGFGVVQGTVEGGQFASFANVTPPYRIRAITREQENVNLELSNWNPLGGP